MKIIKSEKEYCDKCPFATSLDIWIKHNVQYDWFFSEWIIESPDYYAESSTVIFKSYNNYPERILSIKATRNHGMYGFEIIKLIF